MSHDSVQDGATQAPPELDNAMRRGHVSDERLSPEAKARTTW